MNFEDFKVKIENFLKCNLQEYIQEISVKYEENAFGKNIHLAILEIKFSDKQIFHIPLVAKRNGHSYSVVIDYDVVYFPLDEEHVYKYMFFELLEEK